MPAANFPILVAEDDALDADLLERALRRAGITGFLHFVPDGAQAIEYLEGRGPYAERSQFPFPKVIITDLKMPRVTGLELLQWLSSHRHCHVIPTILLSSSAMSQDIASAYKLGASTYFQKPTTFEGLVKLMTHLKHYWCESELPVVDAC
jgi:CheY-like chemotaxis protein